MANVNGAQTDTTMDDGNLKRKDQNEFSEDIRRYDTATSVIIPKEAFEFMFTPPHLRHQTRSRMLLRNTFANPMPMPLMGFLMASTPLGWTLMGWRGAGGGGAALIGTFYFFGGGLQVIGGVLEWIIGNTFPFVVFCSYGAFWLTMGITLTPAYNAEGAYVSSSASAAAQAAGLSMFKDTFGFLYLIMTLLSFIYVVASIRTNLVLWLIFFFIDMAFFLLTASEWVSAEGRADVANKLQIAGGAFVFVFCILGWYLFIHLILESMDFPYNIPIWDLSQKVLVKKDKKTNNVVMDEGEV